MSRAARANGMLEPVASIPALGGRVGMPEDLGSPGEDVAAERAADSRLQEAA
jgi:hypothetical protein